MSDDPTTATWWESVDEHLRARESNAPDPWADVELHDPALTVEQADFLAGLDQPAPPRVATADPFAPGPPDD